MTIEWLYADTPVREDDVRDAGKTLGVVFPEDYVECAAKNNGADVEPYLFDVGNTTKSFGTLLMYDEDDSEYIIKIFHDYKDTLPKGLIPFAFDPAGNLICFDYEDRTENPIIVFWEHEGAEEKEVLISHEGLTEEEAEKVARENVFYVADTFTDFLNKLHD
ncbi:SMI1/KNR4 family protein [Priestia endophytica]|uniref:SMI1/KNR4 family protein n=1 Tax=Priestia endophytica TaxID=135735 RepID=UPI000F5334C0|nr:SMI1/KNR4 family protein [Priestia endophytica]RPK15237.1 hypothetical protein FH5_00672 [Priestia endophytica]